MEQEMGRARFLYLLLALCGGLLWVQSCAQTSVDTSEELHKVSSELFQQGEYEKAIPTAEESLAIKEKTYGSNHLETAQSLNFLAGLYHLTGDNTKAKSMYERSLKIRKETLGLKHPDTAQSLVNLAQVYRAMGQYDEAISFAEQGLKIYEETLGPEHSYTAATLQTLASVYRDLGDYDQAVNLQTRSLAIYEKSLGSEHTSTAISRNQLGVIYSVMGDFENAEKLLQKSLEINEKHLQPEHPEIATNLHNLARLKEDTGDYAEAERLYRRSLAIKRNTLGPKHPWTAVGLSSIGHLYMFLGEYAKAEVLLNRSLSIRETVYGPDHPKTATGLGALSSLYIKRGEYSKAQSLLNRSLSINEVSYGSQHPAVGSNLGSLAFTYYQVGEHIKAEPLFKRSLSIYKATLGSDHPATGNCLYNLANFYSSMGEWDKAEQLVKSSLSIMEKSLGPNHPDTVSKLNALGKIYAAQENYSEAHELLIRVQTATAKLIDQIMGFSSGQQQLRFMATQQWDLYKAISLVAFHMPDDQAALRDIFNMWLSRKGIILEMQKRFQEALAYSDNPEILEASQELARIRGRLSRFIFNPPPSTQLEMRKEQIFYLEEEKLKIEAKLSRISQEYLHRQKIQNARCTEIAPVLPSNSALVEFAKIRRFNFGAKSREEAWLPEHYLVFILPSDGCDRLSLHDLGPASEIDTLISQLKSEIKKNIDTGTRRRLHELVFEPIQNKLKRLSEIFVSPDGNLNLIPFEILEDQNGTFLIEDFTFNYLSAGRDLSGFQKQGEGSEEKSLIIGDPDYNWKQDRSNRKRDDQQLTPESSRVGSKPSDMRGMRFTRLPGTLAEANAISEVIGTDASVLKTGTTATEEEIFQAEAPRILHFATHGFFLGDQDTAVYGDDRDILEKKTERAKYGFYSPLLRSGLALAGANAAVQSENKDNSQGLLTAEKVLGLNLKGTELVVLSACDTGLGKVQAGEGVYGLRRAFLQSGTKSLVMSMWQIPDRETKELMIKLYRNIESGMNRSQALRQAALAQKAIVEERYGKPYPLFWGAFVFLGEP